MKPVRSWDSWRWGEGAEGMHLGAGKKLGWGKSAGGDQRGH